MLPKTPGGVPCRPTPAETSVVAFAHPDPLRQEAKRLHAALAAMSKAEAAAFAARLAALSARLHADTRKAEGGEESPPDHGDSSVQR